MRKSTLLWLLLATFCGISLFHTSQKLHDDRAKILLLDRNIAQEEESLRVLQAEWSHLNDPARLEKLAAEHLGLSPLKGSQFATVEELPLRGAAAHIESNSIVSVMPALRGHPEARQRVLSSQHDGLTAFQTPAQGGGDIASNKEHKPLTKTASRSLNDVFKSLGVAR